MVKALAAAGTLETLQLINRQLATLPDELRGCHDLKYLYDPTIFKIVDASGKHTAFLLSRMNGITELPSLTRAAQLDRMEFTMVKHLAWIPDLKPIGPVVHFAVYKGAHLCCNGFLGACDLSNPFCEDTRCLDDASPKATTATLQVFNIFSAHVCEPYSGLSQTPTPATIQICDGVPFRQCQLPGLQPISAVVGMCYNHRMQVLACNTVPTTIRVRIRQIQDNVGTPCDPVEEAWLGCEGSTAITM
ncbi:hypothetical protein JG687_00018287 [Phytophthora cactorum]|uniref:WLGC domain-containing protein n=1 Tax=Phytophthora cactorum TaxID=29920 RepID=A0A8T1TM23_9STRA|nr:hypothetical protein JG687_00018287 [Phytophthora cactorum]